MLTHIHISNFAIVHDLELNLERGFTVLTGETGAGKSILIDALGLVLGDRADSMMVRHGADKADISAQFDLAQAPQALAWLRARELESDADCVLRRTINKDGGSRSYINGQPATLQAVRELGELLVDIHGQHAHQSLLKPAEQRRLVDEYAGNQTRLTAVAGRHQVISRLLQEREQLSGSQHGITDRLELLRYQAQELDSFAPRAGEPQELAAEHGRLAHAHQILESGQSCLHQLKSDTGPALLQQLAAVTGQLRKLQSFDERIAAAGDLLESAQIQIQEGVSELRHYLDGIDTDPQRLQAVEQRMSDYHQLARKHHVEVDAVPDLAAAMAQELRALEQKQQRLLSLDDEIARARDDYWRDARALSEQRMKGAKKLARAVTAHMQELGLKGAAVEVQVTVLEGDEGISAHGCNRVEFLVSTNPGQPPRPLAKIASGGELSRISLCIQVVNSGFGVPTLIFDEVDVGVGGSVAELVGQKLRALGEDHQVLCVTHLPQVAALGHQHLQVNKRSVGASTQTAIDRLQEDTRVMEVARMLGGLELTAQTIAHAREMLQRGTRGS